MFAQRMAAYRRSRLRNFNRLAMALMVALPLLCPIPQASAQDQSQTPPDQAQDQNSGKPKQDVPTDAGGPSGDVGPYTIPKKNPEAELYPSLSFDEAIAIVLRGAKVLHPRCICLAAKNNLPLKVVSFYDPMMRHHSGTWIGEPAAPRGVVPIFEGIDG